MRLTFALLAFLMAALPAHAATFKTPYALLHALYLSGEESADPDDPSIYSPYFSDRLNARFRRDLDRTAEGDSGAIDFDPVIAGNDGEVSNVEIGTPIVIGKTAELEVTFTNNGPVTLYYTLVREHGGWKVDDIANQQGDMPWSLSDLFDNAVY